MDDFLQFDEPWFALTPGEGGVFELELQAEVGPGHVLDGVAATAIGRREDCDDVLYRLDGAQDGFAVVHLTYRGRPEVGPAWPATVLYESAAALQERLDADSEAYRIG